MTGNDDDESAAGLTRLGQALSARATLRGWAAGGEVVALVRAARDAGWLEPLRAGTTDQRLADVAGVPVPRASAVTALFVAAGLVDDQDGLLRLTPDVDALVAEESGVGLDVVLDALDLARDRARHALDPAAPSTDDPLVVARDRGVLPTAASRRLYAMLYDALPEYRERLESGGPLLDAGSGVGGALLTTLALFGTLRAVGVELSGDVVAETRRRARDAGVADRVDLRVGDVADLADGPVFTACFWAQAFFVRDARRPALDAILRVLRPDGLLLMQELLPPRPAEGAGMGDLADDVTFAGRDIAVGLSAEALSEEAVAAGFAPHRIAATPLGRLVLVRKPA